MRSWVSKVRAIWSGRINSNMYLFFARQDRPHNLLCFVHHLRLAGLSIDPSLCPHRASPGNRVREPFALLHPLASRPSFYSPNKRLDFSLGPESMEAIKALDTGMTCVITMRSVTRCFVSSHLGYSHLRRCRCIYIYLPPPEKTNADPVPS